jgi:hypothetical protein
MKVKEEINISPPGLNTLIIVSSIPLLAIKGSIRGGFHRAIGE